MPSTSETGHAKNVANFEDLISFCNAYGTTYNPSKESLSVVKLKELQTQAKEILQQVKTTKTSFDNATNARQIAFKDLKPLVTKIVNALSVSGATPAFVSHECKVFFNPFIPTKQMLSISQTQAIKKTITFKLTTP